VGSSQLEGLMEMARWLVRLRIPNECLILNKINLAAIMARNSPDKYRELKDSLPPWILFYNLAGYDYLPEKRVRAHEEDTRAIAQRAGVEPARAVGQINAFDLLKIIQAPAGEPYWKLMNKGASQDLFFITNFQSIYKTIDTMYQLTDQANYSATDLGVYIQPLVQGSNYHVEFNFFYDPYNSLETEKVRGLVSNCVNPLISQGAFFSRPYGETARAILTKDAATVQALRKVKMILDPDNVMNPGKLCF
jgi:hypothetical protein